MQAVAKALRRMLPAALTAAVLVVPAAGAARAAIPAPPPARLAPLAAGSLAPGPLAARYAANRRDITAAARMARQHGNTGRAALLRGMAASQRTFLTFDGRGTGLATEVFGDLPAADRIAVLVPGADTELATYGRLHADAAALYAQVRRREPRARAVIVAWLGYRTPATISTGVLTTARAEQAAPALRDFVAALHTAAPGARLSLVCHSYGSVVCGRAAAGLPIADLALVGSPGTGAASAAGLHTRATVWAGRDAQDWVADIPHLSAHLLGTTIGLGADPVAPGFGARVFAAGGGGHSAYFDPDSTALRNLARIVLGRYAEVTHG